MVLALLKLLSNTMHVTNVVKPSAVVDGVLFCIPLFHLGWPDFALMARILDSWNCRLSVGKFWQCPCPRLVERRTVLRGRLMSDSQSRFQGPLRHRALSQSKLCLLFRSLLRQIWFLRAAQGLINCLLSVWMRTRVVKTICLWGQASQDDNSTWKMNDFRSRRLDSISKI